MMGPAPYPWLTDVWSQFGDALAADRLGHAVLLVGPPSVGKDLLSRAIAAALLCRERVGRRAAFPCGVCDACVQVAGGHHPDLHRVEADDKSGVIGIASVRDLCTQLHLTSQMAGYRVGLVPHVDRCSISATNSLLKTLEEPPPGVFLLLSSARPGRLPATVRSRCQLWRCAPPPTASAVQWLRDQGVANPERALHLAGGLPLAALSPESAALDEALKSALHAVLSGQQSISQGAKSLEQRGTESILSALVGLIDEVIASAAASVTTGQQIACFGVTRSAKQLFTWRDAVVCEFARNRTGLNELATLERVLAAGCGDVPAAVIG